MNKKKSRISVSLDVRVTPFTPKSRYQYNGRRMTIAGAGRTVARQKAVIETREKMRKYCNTIKSHTIINGKGIVVDWAFSDFRGMDI